jgi:D-glucosaminate-6-phosphate ammonia-lyase
MSEGVLSAEERGADSVYDVFGVRPVINCCGIYTDLGGSVLSSSVWRAAEELNHSYIKMTELLAAAGGMIASLVGAENSRVTPGASAAIALAVAATMTGADGRRWEQLPDTRGLKSKVVIARAHSRRYKYASCVRMPGARLVEAGPADRFDLDSLLTAVTTDTACVFVPAHLLDGFTGVAQLTVLVEGVHRLGVPVVVDAAYLSYPLDLLGQFARCGADLSCFSAKYFFGPNSGGFVAGRRELIDIVAGLDFTRFESGPFRKFGRPFKMSRYDVASTALALREWFARDHAKRWEEYADKVASIAASLPSRTDIHARSCLFTMSEELVSGPTVNCLALSFDQSPGYAASIAKELEAGDPIIAAIVQDETLIVAVDALLDGQERLVGERLARALAT